MAQIQSGRRPAPQSGHGNWLSDTGNAIDQARRLAEAKGREIWEAALREGRPIAARTEAELRELGAKALQEAAHVAHQGAAVGKGVAAVARNPHSAEAQRFIRESKNQASAFGHGAGDAITFGLADHGSSVVRAALQSKGDWSQWNKNYHADMDQERNQDAFEEANYGEARGAGQIAGTAASLLIPGADLGLVGKAGATAFRYARPALDGVMKALPAIRTLGVPVVERMAEATPAIMKERIAAGVASGGMGAGVQAGTDAIEGRPITAGDLAAAGVGGFVQGISGHRLGHIGTGAVGGAVTAGLGDAFNNRPVTLSHVALGSAVGAGAGGLSGVGLGRWSDALPNLKYSAPITSGDVGELLSVGRSLARGNTPTIERTLIRPRTKPGAMRDHSIDGGIPVEAKFGRDWGLRKGQQVVYDQGRYARVDHFTPQDVATIASIPASQIAADTVNGLQQNSEDRKKLGWNLRSLLVVPGY